MQENEMERGTRCRCQLAIATVPMQRFEQLYPVPEA